MKEMNRVSDEIQNVKISRIDVGNRIRKSMGDIDSLSLSLRIKGQIQPLWVTLGEGDKLKLVEGERRIRAALAIGWTKIDVILFEALSDRVKMEYELLAGVQREDFPFLDEALAVRSIVEQRKAESLRGVGNCAQIFNKDIAIELNMSEPRMSENMRIAEAYDEHPELEAKANSRSEFLRMVRNQDYYVPKGSELENSYKESFLVNTAQGCIETINDKIVDLCILHPDHVDEALLDSVHAILKPLGQILIFSEHRHIHEWETALKKKKMNVGATPYIWVVKGDDSYQNFLWAGKNIMSPMRPMVNMLAAARPKDAFSQKSKPMALVANIIKSCTERGAFILVPECHDIETVRAALETGRNIRCAISNKNARDQMILNIVNVDK